MKKYFTFAPLIAGILFFSIACSNDTETDENGEKEDTPKEEAMVEKEEVSDGPFQMKSGVINYEMKSISGEITATHTLHFKNYGNTIRLEETVDGETSVFLFDESIKKGLTIWAGRKPSKSFMRQGEINTYVAVRGTSGFTKEADEAILGMNCEVYANNAKTESGDAKVKFWLHGGIALKEINHLGTGYMFEAVRIEEKPVDAKLFSELDDLK